MRYITPRPSVSAFARRYLARKKAILDAIDKQVKAHPTVRFTGPGGRVETVLNTTDRTSFDPKVRDLWEDLDRL